MLLSLVLVWASVLFGVLFPPFFTAICVFLQLSLRARLGYRNSLLELNGTIKDNPRKFEKKVKSARKRLRRLVISFLIFSFVASYSLTGGCISFYEGYIGIKIKAIDLSVSTTLTRYFELDEACPPGPPCHIYATLPEDTATGVFINAQTHVDVHSITVKYDTKEWYEANGYCRNSVESWSYKLDHMETNGRRTIHVCTRKPTDS